MNTTDRSSWRQWLAALVLLAAGLLAALARFALPPANWPAPLREFLGVAAAPGHEAPDHNDTEHAPHSVGEESLRLSAAAWKNLGLRTGVITAGSFQRTVPIPAIVVERAGRSQVAVTAPLTGIVTRIHPIEGETVEPGRPLVDLRLTHEDLVTSQRDFLRTAEELDVVEREIARLEGIGEGVVAGRQVLAQQYERDKLRAGLRAQRQGLLLHGLSAEQVDHILASRELLQTLTVTVPPFDDAEHRELEHLFHVQSIAVTRGEQVEAGARLLALADHCELFVEGSAFEDDIPRVQQAARESWKLAVAPLVSGEARGEPEQLEVLFVSDAIDPESRALRFYLTLPNAIERDQRRGEHRFVSWKYRPGQRMQVEVPIGEPWEGQIVLPRQAVVEEGAEAFVFEQNGEYFDRIPVHVLYRDRDSVVIENDGRLLGSTLALSGAYRMHLAILSQTSGGGMASHGHSH